MAITLQNVNYDGMMLRADSDKGEFVCRGGACIDVKEGHFFSGQVLEGPKGWKESAVEVTFARGGGDGKLRPVATPVEATLKDARRAGEKADRALRRKRT